MRFALPLLLLLQSPPQYDLLITGGRVNVKGAVFNGLKVILLSVTHRVFDAIKAENELTGRFTAISLPHWSTQDLAQIPAKGFDVLGTTCPNSVVDVLCTEAQESPFLMQKFCWEISFDLKIERKKLIGTHVIPEEYDLKVMFKRRGCRYIRS